MGAAAADRVNATTIRAGYKIAVVRNDDGDLIKTTRKTGILTATVVGKDIVPAAQHERQRRYVIRTDQGDTVPVPGITTFTLISAPDGDQGDTPDVTGVEVDGVEVAVTRRIDISDSAIPSKPTCTDPNHAPGQMGCPSTVTDCSGIPADAAQLAEQPHASQIGHARAGETGCMTIGRRIVHEFSNRHAVHPVAMLADSDPYGRGNVREFSVWQLSADGHVVTVVRYDGQPGPLVPARSYLAVLVAGELIPDAGKLSAAEHPDRIAWRVAREFRCWLSDRAAVRDAAAPTGQDARPVTITHTGAAGTILTGLDHAAGVAAGLAPADPSTMTRGLWHWVDGDGVWILPRTVGQRPAVEAIYDARERIQRAGRTVTLNVRDHDWLPTSGADTYVPTALPVVAQLIAADAAQDAAAQGEPATAVEVPAAVPQLPTVDGVPAGMPYVATMPQDWPVPAVRLQGKEVCRILRKEFLPAWFPGVKFSVRSDSGSMYTGGDIYWTDGPAQSVVSLVADMWRGMFYDGQSESTSYRGAVLYVNAAGEAVAYDLPGITFSTHRDVTQHAVDAARSFLPGGAGDLAYDQFCDPYARPWRGGARLDCARWMADYGVDQWTREFPSQAACPVQGCALVAGHPFPGVHRNDYGRAFFGTVPDDQGGNGGGVGPDPVPAGPSDGGGFRTWPEVADHITGGRESAPMAQIEPADSTTAGDPGDTTSTEQAGEQAGQGKSVTVTVDGRGEWRIHRPGCRDIGRETTGHGRSWTVQAPDVRSIVTDTYGHDADTDWRQFADPRVMPCLDGGLPDVAEQQGDAPTVAALRVGDYVHVSRWQDSVFVLSVDGDRFTGVSGGEGCDLPTSIVTRVETLTAGAMIADARVVLQSPLVACNEAGARQLAGIPAWIDGKPQPGMRVHVAALDTTDGQRITDVELVIERATQLGCSCWRIECFRPGPVLDGNRAWVNLRTGCVRHEQQCTVPAPVSTEPAAVTGDQGDQGDATDVPAAGYDAASPAVQAWRLLGAVTSFGSEQRTRMFRAMRRVHGLADLTEHAEIMADREALISARDLDSRSWPGKCAAYLRTYGALLTQDDKPATMKAEPQPAPSWMHGEPKAGQLVTVPELDRTDGQRAENVPLVAERVTKLGCGCWKIQGDRPGPYTEGGRQWVSVLTGCGVHDRGVCTPDAFPCDLQEARRRGGEWHQDGVSADAVAAGPGRDPVVSMLLKRYPVGEGAGQILAAFRQGYADAAEKFAAQAPAMVEQARALAEGTQQIADRNPAAQPMADLHARQVETCEREQNARTTTAQQARALADNAPSALVRALADNAPSALVLALAGTGVTTSFQCVEHGTVTVDAPSDSAEVEKATSLHRNCTPGDPYGFEQCTPAAQLARSMPITVRPWVTAHLTEGPTVPAEQAAEAPSPAGEGADPVARWERLAWALVNAAQDSPAGDRRGLGDLSMCRVHQISDPAEIVTARQADPRDWPTLCAAYWDAYAVALAEGGHLRVLSAEPEPASTVEDDDQKDDDQKDDDQDAPVPAGGVAGTHPAPEGRMVKRPTVGACIHTDAHGVCEVVAVHGRGGESVGVRNAAGERLSLTRHHRAHWLVVDAPAGAPTDDEDDTTDDDDPRSIYRLPVQAYAPELDSDADAEITIRHDHEDGTVIEGSSRGDGVWEIAKGHGLECRHGVIFKRHTRDRFADLSAIGKLAGALRADGHTVAVEVDDVWRPASDREDARAVRVSERAGRLAERASRKFGEANARMLAARTIGDGMPFGEPIKIGHHSERAHRRAFERIEANDRASYAARDYAEELARRADAAERNEAGKQGPRAIMRRVEALKTDRRAWLRRLADTDKGTTGYARTCRLHIERLSEDIAFQLAKLGDLAESGAFVAWSAESLQRGDWVNVGGDWREVARVNRKGVSVRALYQWDTRDDIRPVTWDQIHGRRRDGVQHDSPNGQGWPVEQAQHVARWARLLQSLAVNHDRGDMKAIMQRVNVQHARQIVLGVRKDATAQEIAAFGEPADVAGKRARALAMISVYDRLAEGETYDQVAETVTPIGDTEPAWRMPEGEPVEVFPRELVPGDIVAGVRDDLFGMRGLSTAFVGPVTAFPRHLDRRESGDWEVIQIAGEVHEVRSHRRFAVHQVGTR